MSEPTLTERIRRLEDIEALKLLKSRYAEYCNNDYNPDQLASLFTEDAIWDGGALGKIEGRDAIREFFAGASKVLPFAIHHVTNPALEIDGDRATGRWLLWQPCTHATGEQALWIAGDYHDEYRREDGEWRFAKVTFHLNMMSPYEAGWSKVRMVGGGTVMTPKETTKLFYELFASGKVEELLERLVDADCELYNPLPDPIKFGGRFEGRQGVATYLQGIAMELEIQQFEIDEILADGERVTVLGRETSRVRRTNKCYTMSWVHVLTVRNGRILSFREYNDTAAMAAAYA